MPTCLTCTPCEARKTNPLTGRFNMACKNCCAILVAKTYPDKAQAKAMLAAVVRHPGSPPKGEVLTLVAELVKR